MKIDRSPRPATYLYPVRRHWYTGRFNASAITDKAERLRELPRGVRLLSRVDHDTGEYGHTVMTFRVPAAAARAAPEILAEVLTYELQERGLTCSCEHDCCGHRTYGTARLIRRRRREVTVRQGWSLNI